MRREEVPWPAVKAPSPAVGVFLILFISKEQRWEGLSAKSACLSIWPLDGYPASVVGVCIVCIRSWCAQDMLPKNYCVSRTCEPTKHDSTLG
jgi:hypothetical protein